MSAMTMSTKMSRSEIVVAGLALALIVAGFATAVLAKPIRTSPHSAFASAHVISVQARATD